MRDERNSQVIRQWQIVGALEGAHVGRTINELAHEHQVPRRTVLRDLQAFEAAGFPLVTEPIPGTTENRRRMLRWRQDAPHAPRTREVATKATVLRFARPGAAPAALRRRLRGRRAEPEHPIFALIRKLLIVRPKAVQIMVPVMERLLRDSYEGSQRGA